MLNPALFGLFMGAIVWARAGPTIPLRRIPIPLIDFGAIRHDFCGLSDVKVVVNVRLLLKI
jgi:hypothetical protein